MRSRLAVAVIAAIAGLTSQFPAAAASLSEQACPTFVSCDHYATLAQAVAIRKAESSWFAAADDSVRWPFPVSIAPFRPDVSNTDPAWAVDAQVNAGKRGRAQGLLSVLMHNEHGKWVVIAVLVDPSGRVIRDPALTVVAWQAFICHVVPAAVVIDFDL